MLFNSFSFLIFFPVVVLLYFILPEKLKMYWLLIASYYFYMSWNVKYGLLILFSTVVTYLCGLLIDSSASQGRKKFGFVLCLVVNFGILFFFKYFTWLLGDFNHLFHLDVQLPFTIILPVGISFYTFQALGYTIDVYRGDIRAERNFFTYALFVSFFPQLVAGPIERSTNLLHQLQKPTKFNAQHATQGLQIMLWGYVEKMVIADNLGRIVDTVYGNWQNYSGSILLLATALFAIQIYCDFGGYSHIAIGAARVLNVNLMNNFRQPFFATTIREFWQRWHISLSLWFRDYLYFPLGGSRCSKPRKYLNVMITFLVSGLWHGAAWTYVIWGGINGLYQVIGETLMPLRKKIVSALHMSFDGLVHMTWQRICVYFMFVFSMVFFRSDSGLNAIHVLGRIAGMFHPRDLVNGTIGTLGLSSAGWLVTGIGLALLLIVDSMQELQQNTNALGVHSKRYITPVKHKHSMTVEPCHLALYDSLDQRPIWVRWIVYYALLLLVIIAALQRFGQGASAFLYFQF